MKFDDLNANFYYNDLNTIHSLQTDLFLIEKLINCKSRSLDV